MSFFRTFEHLLPDAAAWRLTVGKQLRQLFEGLAQGFDDARVFVDDVYDDLFPTTTRELEAWEEQFGLRVGSTDAIRRQNLAAAWQAVGGQSPRYLQDVIQAAGFPLFIHEWWSSGPDPSYVARDPRLYTSKPLFGTIQCGEALAQCGESGAVANRFLANEPGYLVNLNLTPTAPPVVPDDPNTWPYFLYFSGETFADVIEVSSTRRAELEELLLQLCPTQQWIVLRVNFIETSRRRITLQSDPRVTLAADSRVTLGS